MRRYKRALQAVLALCALLVMGESFLVLLPARAVNPYHITFSTGNFALQTLSASANDLSNPGHVLFSLQNGTQFWYGLAIQSNPGGITPTPASASDLVATTFYGSVPLLPPMGVLPFDQGTALSRAETLRLALAFSGPDQQVQLQLNPFESHAVTLDVLTMLLQLLGYKGAGEQIGLLAPGGLKLLFADASALQDLTLLVNDYTQALQSQSSSSSALTAAFACAKDMVALLADASEQSVLADLLWKLLGKTLPYSAIVKSVVAFAGAQFALGIEEFINDETTLMVTMLFQQSNPTVTIQSVSNSSASQTPSPSASATPTSPTVLPTASPEATPTAGATPSGSPNPTPTASSTAHP
jgi:hypothetical protein